MKDFLNALFLIVDIFLGITFMCLTFYVFVHGFTSLDSFDMLMFGFSFYGFLGLIYNIKFD